ncbi:hypothetical protein BDQ12DRAFT_582075, partial [Crucibulum laeve]
GKDMDPVEFYDVLHVPALQNSLLSLFHLTHKKGYNVNITNSVVNFLQSRMLCFFADITLTMLAIYGAELSTISTCPMDISLWHHQCGHQPADTICEMIKKELVTGIRCMSTAKSNPICEPCIAGKLHCHNIP